MKDRKGKHTSTINPNSGIFVMDKGPGLLRLFSGVKKG